MTGGGQDTSYSDNSSTMLIIVIVIVVLAHIAIMAIIIYYSCCRHKCCVCRINIQNNTIHQNSLTDSSRVSATLAQDDSTDSESLEDSRERPVTSWNNSLITRVRTRLQGSSDGRTSSTPASGLPPPYSESDSSSGHVNFSANLEDIDLHLPTYEDSVRRLPTWEENEETGRSEMEKPPTYEEATENKRRGKR